VSQARGLTKDDWYMMEPAEAAQRRMKRQDKKEKNKGAFGWEVFNQVRAPYVHPPWSGAAPGQLDHPTHTTVTTDTHPSSRT
jgi:hypothetical protein